MWLPSGGSLVIDNTEAMTVVNVNTGKFTGQGGNLEETVTRNNLEAAEEIVRQLRLRDVGGIIVIDFIDMVLESNRELVLRRLLECLARDRTKHQVAEVTSLGLVQMTRKRVGVRAAGGLLRAVRLLQRARRDHLARPDRARPAAAAAGGDGRGAKENRQSKGGKNGKESGRRTAEAGRGTGDDDDSGTGPDDAAAGEAGAGGDAAGEPAAGGAAPTAPGDGAAGDGAGADGNGADGAGRGRRGRRRAPPAPGRHPPAGPSRARQPAAGTPRPAGWPRRPGAAGHRASRRRICRSPSPAGEPGARSEPGRGAQSASPVCGARTLSPVGARACEPSPRRLRPDGAGAAEPGRGERRTWAESGAGSCRQPGLRAGQAPDAPGLDGEAGSARGQPRRPAAAPRPRRRTAVVDGPPA